MDIEQKIREILAELKKLDLERTGIVSRIDGINVQVRNLDPNSESEIDTLLEQIALTQKRLLANRHAILKLKEKFDELRKNL